MKQLLATPYFDILVVGSLVILGVSILALYFYFITFKSCTMGKLEELQQALEEQQAKIAAEKEQVSAILTEQNENIKALEEQIATGASPEQLQQLLDKVKTNTAALIKIYEAPGEEEGGGGSETGTSGGDKPAEEQA